MEPARAFMALDGTRAAAHALTEIARISSAPGDHDDRGEESDVGASAESGGDASDESEEASVGASAMSARRGKTFMNSLPSDYRGLGVRSFSTDDLMVNAAGTLSPVKREASGIGALLKIMSPWATSNAAALLKREASFEERAADVQERLTQRRHTTKLKSRRRPSSNSVGGRRPSYLAATAGGVAASSEASRPASVTSGTGSSSGTNKELLPTPGTGVRVPLDGAFREVLQAGGNEVGGGMRMWGVAGGSGAPAGGTTGASGAAPAMGGGGGGARSAEDAVVTDMLRKSKVMVLVRV